MHFGQYAFGLFHRMYLDEIEHAGQEGWPDEPSISDPAEIPAAILENNLFGIDIDPRAIQIASLSLLLTAKEAALRHGLLAARCPGQAQQSGRRQRCRPRRGEAASACRPPGRPHWLAGASRAALRDHLGQPPERRRARQPRSGSRRRHARPRGLGRRRSAIQGHHHGYRANEQEATRARVDQGRC